MLQEQSVYFQTFLYNSSQALHESKRQIMSYSKGLALWMLSFIHLCKWMMIHRSKITYTLHHISIC